MAWKLVVAQTDGTPIGEITVATQRKYIWPLDDVANISFTLDGQHPQAKLPVELVTDCLVYDEQGVLRFRGRTGQSQDQVATTGEQAQMTAADYRGMLGRRIGPLAAEFVLTEQAAIAWNLIQGTQGADGGDLGIAQGAGSNTGVERTIQFTDGTMVAAEINQMAALGDGFEWEIDASLLFNVYYPQRGNDTDVVLDYPGHVLSFQRTLDPTQYANAVRFSGVGDLPVVTVESPALPSSPVPLPGTPGRFDIAVSDTTITDSTTLALRAAYALSQDDLLPVGYQMVLKDGWWSPEQLWIGDTCQLELHSGRINESSRQRVTQVEVDPNDDGGNTVTITTGVIPSDEGTDIQALLERLTLLELYQQTL